MAIGLFDYQLDAIDRMKTGCILCGGVGSGKSRTAIAYFLKTEGYDVSGKSIKPNKKKPIRDLYIITTARKRDSYEWDSDMCHFLLSRENNAWENKVIVDSWNNIGKYTAVTDAFFIFDEQRVVGYGAWTKSFLKITKSNDWILLSATPGDCWSDYIPVFIANGFFRNKTQFNEEHVEFDRYCKFPRVAKYHNTRRLTRLRDAILVDMDFNRQTVAHHDYIPVEYDMAEYKQLQRSRFSTIKQAPIENASELCYELRRIVNTHPSRLVTILEIFEKHPRLIIFYSFDYELEILRDTFYSANAVLAEWNGHKHEEIPKTDSWVYLVQYTAGAEGWNCVSTDTIVFYSQQYSYKILEQASGRIDRLNTPYRDLYYYHLQSKAPIDLAIARAIKSKKKFNERKFVEGRNRN